MLGGLPVERQCAGRVGLDADTLLIELGEFKLSLGRSGFGGAGEQIERGVRFEALALRVQPHVSKPDQRAGVTGFSKRQ